MLNVNDREYKEQNLHRISQRIKGKSRNPHKREWCMQHQIRHCTTHGKHFSGREYIYKNGRSRLN